MMSGMGTAVKETPRKNKWVWARPKQWIVAAAVAGGVIAVDQISKFLVVTNIGLNQWVKVIDPLLYFTHTHNYQGIFSINFGHPLLHIALPVAAMIFVVFLLLRRQPMFFTVLMGVILGGGISNNLIDRIRLGYVVDWINMGLHKWRFWGTYNIADASLVIAVIILLVYELFFVRKPEGEQQKEPTVRD
jgi:signal peptidase II